MKDIIKDQKQALSEWDSVTILNLDDKSGVLQGYTSELQTDILYMPEMPKMPSKWFSFKFWIRKNIFCRLGKHMDSIQKEVEYQNLWTQSHVCLRCDETWESIRLKQIKLVSNYDFGNN